MSVTVSKCSSYVKPKTPGEENSKSCAGASGLRDGPGAPDWPPKSLAFHESQQPEESEQRSEDKDGREVQAVAGNDTGRGPGTGAG